MPVVIRGPGGVGRQLGAEHSQRLESYFQSIPGVQLVACSTVANSKALLKSAIRSDNPIIFFEHVLLYNVKGKLPCFPPDGLIFDCSEWGGGRFLAAGWDPESTDLLPACTPL